jgi:hypothetical protein
VAQLAREMQLTQEHASKNFIMSQFADQENEALSDEICAFQGAGCPYKGGADKDFSPSAPALFVRNCILRLKGCHSRKGGNPKACRHGCLPTGQADPTNNFGHDKQTAFIGRF